MTDNAFSTLPIRKDLLENLEALGFSAMTPVQAKSLPPILAGRDVLAQAKTGSGKTAAFGVGLLSRLAAEEFAVQALVLCPTRELADQVGKELRRLARFTANVKVLTLCGGTPLGPQIGSLAHGAHVVVGTPGRIQDHLQKGSLTLDALRVLVLDEADRMLDMGFAPALDVIVAACPRERQTLLFSATYPKAIGAISARVQNDPVEVVVESQHDTAQIQQHFYEVPTTDAKLPALKALLSHFKPVSSVIFCNTRKDCQHLHQQLSAEGLSVTTLHGDLEQRDRDQVLVRFANRSVSLLVATDVAARGLDIKELDAVINYELPRDPEVYVHRIGRTGRAGEKGLALSLVQPSETHRVQRVQDYQQKPAHWSDLNKLEPDPAFRLIPEMVTLGLDSGRKNKLRPGDIVGALTGDAGIAGDQIGKIDVFDFQAYVAVARGSAKQALAGLESGKIKGRKVKVRRIT
ncbi:ATP-dependent RNA helicase DbpA [Hydrocarboniclastica marina]|uniref:ATP-dependent RNA helicase DbpA n=1 Tax=Hydrocarboniclastica marina TaxID=2259620 RepID=A0A4P7XCT1_9ALTE|nr:ATP-dependent RNA helicase DbpA [Hydrocarboniclastica marina]QCF24621.1 ATP-dependent RNA helicase DbpA [Hydrocarboniclastica marina]